jgi:SAM-dependent methyltransferase
VTAELPTTGDEVAAFDLVSCLGRLADRRAGRTEADIQADVRDVLLYGGLNISEDQLVLLEAPVGAQRRIDVEVGFTVIEVKKDLRNGRVRERAVEQLAGYVSDRCSASGGRYVGILTDGAEWELYHLVEGQLDAVSSLKLDPLRPDAEGLRVWLDGALATTEAITPTPGEIERRLGAYSSAYALDFADLAALYRAHGDTPAVALKRELWAKLLRTAFGTSFRDEETLFISHTLLVAMAEIVGHAIIGIDVSDKTVSPGTLLSGALFAQAQIGGVVEADFFDWPLEVPGGERFVTGLARRLSRFAWAQVEHDVMKVLYESVISTEQRHRLGEYYTPDWLAQEIVAATVTDPLSNRVLDPACGSGTFLFWTVREVLDAAERAGMSNAEAITTACENVFGLDVHPVAVTLARVTYLLAIGAERLAASDRPAISVPVYLGDSIGWAAGESTLFTSDALTVPTADGAQLFADELRFPDNLLTDAGRFDRLVGELSDRATKRAAGSAVPSLAAVFRRYAIGPDDQPMLTETFKTLCALHDQGRDHIWGYYVRNLARPAWLSRPENRVDALVGNPPWLAYRFMTPAMQGAFREMSTERGLWAGAAVATHQDLSGLFVVRCVERYLRKGGHLGFVMPLAVLSRRQFAGFRSGRYATKGEVTTIAFDAAWDLHLVKPGIFKVPPSVILGHRSGDEAIGLLGASEVWSGRLPARNVTSEAAAGHLARTSSDVASSNGGGGSPYRARFANGATVFPRVLAVVERAPESPLGAGAGRMAVSSRRSANEKRPWKTLQSLTGSVETQFVRRMHLGETVLPYRLLGGPDESLDLYPGLAEWWRHAEALWMEHRSSDRLSLLDQLDYRHKLSQQLPAAPHRVVYGASGMYMAAACLSDERAVVEHSLYWAAAASLAETRFLTAVLNSSALTTALRPLQARGEHNPRHYDKYVFDVPIPLYDPDDERHRQLVDWAERAESVARSVELPERLAFEAQRRRIRTALAESDAGREIDVLVRELIGG